MPPQEEGVYQVPGESCRRAGEPKQSAHRGVEGAERAVLPAEDGLICATVRSGSVVVTQHNTICKKRQQLVPARCNIMKHFAGLVGFEEAALLCIARLQREFRSEMCCLCYQGPLECGFVPSKSGVVSRSMLM